MADLDASLMQQILHIPQRERKPNIHHYSKADDLGAGFEVAEWAVFCHPVTLTGANATGKKVPLTLPLIYVFDVVTV
jgi:hypothetical protein